MPPYQTDPQLTLVDLTVLVLVDLHVKVFDQPGVELLVLFIALIIQESGELLLGELSRPITTVILKDIFHFLVDLLCVYGQSSYLLSLLLF